MLTMALCVSGFDPAHALLAFPGAEGYSKHITGGRGGDVIIVNTTRDIVDPNDGLVSLREALEMKHKKRYIVFSVGGVFEVTLNKKQILMAGVEDVTVACQTAPSPGVIIKSGGVVIKNKSRNIITRLSP